MCCLLPKGTLNPSVRIDIGIGPSLSDIDIEVDVGIMKYTNILGCGLVVFWLIITGQPHVRTLIVFAELLRKQDEKRIAISTSFYQNPWNRQQFKFQQTLENPNEYRGWKQKSKHCARSWNP